MSGSDEFFSRAAVDARDNSLPYTEFRNRVINLLPWDLQQKYADAIDQEGTAAQILFKMCFHVHLAMEAEAAYKADAKGRRAGRRELLRELTKYMAEHSDDIE